MIIDFFYKTIWTLFQIIYSITPYYLSIVYFLGFYDFLKISIKAFLDKNLLLKDVCFNFFVLCFLPITILIRKIVDNNEFERVLV